MFLSACGGLKQDCQVLVNTFEIPPNRRRGDIGFAPVRITEISLPLSPGAMIWTEINDKL
jgi:hypothetical protein